MRHTLYNCDTKSQDNINLQNSTASQYQQSDISYSYKTSSNFMIYVNNHIDYKRIGRREIYPLS